MLYFRKEVEGDIFLPGLAWPGLGLGLAWAWPGLGSLPQTWAWPGLGSSAPKVQTLNLKPGPGLGSLAPKVQTQNLKPGPGLAWAAWPQKDPIIFWGFFKKLVGT